MADTAVETNTMNDENDDSWLYGDGNNEQSITENQDKNQEERQTDDTENVQAEYQYENETLNDDEHFAEDGAQDSQNATAADGDSKHDDDSDSDDSDDDHVKVVIGDIKTGPPAYQSLNIKRSGLVVQSGVDKTKSVGKFTVEEFESIGTINGVPAAEFNIDDIEDKPWQKPGADISDYFNYGFNEDTWRAYCERQKRMRVNESGVGLGVLKTTTAVIRRPIVVQKKPEEYQTIPVRENSIQVMTADQREYSGKFQAPQSTQPQQPPQVVGEYFTPPADPYYNDYSQSWDMGNNPNWAPSEIKELTPGPPTMGPPPGMIPPQGSMVGPPQPGMGGPPMVPGHNMNMPPPGMGPPPGMNPHPNMAPPPHHMQPAGPPPPGYYGAPPLPHVQVMEREREARERERERERERDRERRERDRRDEEREDRARSRSIKPDRRERERSHRRERSRSRSHRHKSRSRSRSRHRAESRIKKTKETSSSSRKDKDEKLEE